MPANPMGRTGDEDMLGMEVWDDDCVADGRTSIHPGRRVGGISGSSDPHRTPPPPLLALLLTDRAANRTTGCEVRVGSLSAVAVAEGTAAAVVAAGCALTRASGCAVLHRHHRH